MVSQKEHHASNNDKELATVGKKALAAADNASNGGANKAAVIPSDDRKRQEIDEDDESEDDSSGKLAFGQSYIEYCRRLCAGDTLLFEKTLKKTKLPSTEIVVEQLNTKTKRKKKTQKKRPLITTAPAKGVSNEDSVKETGKNSMKIHLSKKSVTKKHSRQSSCRQSSHRRTRRVRFSTPCPYYYCSNVCTGMPLMTCHSCEKEAVCRFDSCRCPESCFSAPFQCGWSNCCYNFSPNDTRGYCSGCYSQNNCGKNWRGSEFIDKVKSQGRYDKMRADSSNYLDRSNTHVDRTLELNYKSNDGPERKHPTSHTPLTQLEQKCNMFCATQKEETSSHPHIICKRDLSPSNVSSTDTIRSCCTYSSGKIDSSKYSTNSTFNNFRDQAHGLEYESHDKEVKEIETKGTKETQDVERTSLKCLTTQMLNTSLQLWNHQTPHYKVRSHLETQVNASPGIQETLDVRANCINLRSCGQSNQPLRGSNPINYIDSKTTISDFLRNQRIRAINLINKTSNYGAYSKPSSGITSFEQSGLSSYPRSKDRGQKCIRPTYHVRKQLAGEGEKTPIHEDSSLYSSFQSKFLSAETKNEALSSILDKASQHSQATKVQQFFCGQSRIVNTPLQLKHSYYKEGTIPGPYGPRALARYDGGSNKSFFRNESLLERAVR